MSARTAALVASLGLIALLVYLTIRVVINVGFSPFVALSILILGFLAFGVLGALTAPPDE